MKQFRWGVIGCGLIVPKFVRGLEATGEGTVVAAASKSLVRAMRTKATCGIPHVYTSYRRMLQCEQLDAVYIATSHNYHAANAALCLEQGIPVLVEKSFTRNAVEAARIIELAKRKECFMMEAMWMRFNPAIVRVLEMIEQGVIGDVRHLRADFCVKMGTSSKTLPWNRMYSPRLAGGALLDLGVYPLSLARMIFGKSPKRLSGSFERAWTGVDKSSTYSLDYGPLHRAELSSSFVEDKERVATITGTDGIIRIPMFSGASEFLLTRLGRAPERITCEAPGFEHEITEVHRCLAEGRLESDLLPLSQTLETMQAMDTLRAQWGMKYPGE